MISVVDYLTGDPSRWKEGTADIQGQVNRIAQAFRY